MGTMIDTLQYCTLSNWLYSIPESCPSAEYASLDAVLLDDLIERVMEPVVIQDDEIYTRLTIKTGGAGAQVRRKGGVPERICGKEIGRKNQFRVHRGQLVVSSIDARNGAAGIVPEEAEGSVVTDNFWVFTVKDNKVVPSFLQLLLSRPGVLSQIEAISHGTTNRQYITIDQFLKVRVTLPEMPEQKRFLIQYKRLQDRVTKLQAAINSFGDRCETVIKTLVGMTDESSETTKGTLFTVAYQDLYKWNSGEAKQIAPSSSTMRMKDCIAELMTRGGKSLRVTPQKTPAKRFHYVGMENVEKRLGLLTDKPLEATGQDIKSASVAVPKGYVIYGKLRPYLNKYWLNERYQGDVICSSEFLVFRPSEIVNLHYFLAILGSDYIQKQISGKLSGTRMPRLSTSDFLDLEVPFPSMDIQEQIGEECLQIQKEVDGNRKKLKKLRGFETEKLFDKYGI